MRQKRKTFVLGGFVLLLAIVCPQLAVPLLESGVATCAMSPQCSGFGDGDHAD